MKKILLSVLTLLAINTSIIAQNVNIPDANFKAYLVGNASINTNSDTEIQVSEASAFTGQVNCSNLSISDMTGVESFINIAILKCNGNSHTVLDVSALSNLTTLWSNWGALTAIDVSQNPLLTYLNLYQNPLTQVNVANGNNTNFTYLNAGGTSLTCIQVDDVAYSTANWTGVSFLTGTASFSTNCNTVLVTSINVQGQGQGAGNEITTPGGTLQMNGNFFPTNATDGTFTWSATNGTGSASINASGVLTAITNGTVTVVATANDASGVTGTMIVTISNQSVGVNEVALQKVNIYPNPVQNQLFIELYELEITEMVIIDYSGRVVKSITNNNVKSIDVSNLTQGIYVLKISTKEGISTTRFVKQ